MVNETEPIVTFTAAALEQIEAIRASTGRTNDDVRLAIQGRTSSGFRYDLGLVPSDYPTDGAVVVDAGAFKLLVDAGSAPKLKGAVVDFIVGEVGNGGLHIQNPNAVWDSPKALRLQEILDTTVPRQSPFPERPRE